MLRPSLAHRDTCRRRTSRARRDDRRAGFTLVELLVVTAIVGILAGLAIPNFQTMIVRAQAAEVAGDLEVIRVAVLNYNSEYLTWPADAGPGEVPSGLAEFLPENFGFSTDGYSLDYENWSVPSGLPGDPNTTTLIGASVTTDEARLGNALIELLGSAVVFSVDNTHTVLIDRN